MVKADLSRDYYGDLQLQPGAEIAEIKKQFKKLALAYHPDRNPGRETEVTAQFQLIQSAHEVLTDSTERAKYDSSRARSSRGFGSAYAGSSGVRGNPWSDVGSQFPPPPKAPTARRPAQQPSAGAERYKKWEAPKQSAYQAAHEGAGARQKTYEAWESMKTKQQPSGSATPQSSSGGTSRNRPQVPPRGPPPESSSRPSSSARYDRRPESPPRRSNSSTNFKKGFMPNTPGGDEPAASKGAYFTQQYKSAIPPDLPAREPAPSSSRRPRSQHMPSAETESQYKGTHANSSEPRISTPYAGHGGEKLNPFENANINRSKSARESPHRYSSDAYQARPSSSTNLFGEVPSSPGGPHRSHSTRAPPSSRHRPMSSVEIDSDSSDDGPELKSFGKSRTKNSNANGVPLSQSRSHPEPDHGRRPNKVDQYQKAYKENPNFELPKDGFTSTGTSQRSNQQQPNPPIPPKTPADADPTIFTFKVDDDTFKKTSSRRPSYRSFSSSTESISTEFNSKDWDGKFAGAEHFQPDPKAPQPSRSQSGSGGRSRNRSPTKSNMDPRQAQTRVVDGEPIVESPGGTKFSAQEWADTFKPQTFAPPPTSRQVPTRKRTGTNLRPTLGGNAAVVDDGNLSDEKPLFDSRKAPPTPDVPSTPDAMDIDTPQAKNTVPQFIPPPHDISEPPRSPKRPAASPAEDASLKVNFSDLKIQDLLSTLSLPIAPTPPSPPSNLPGTHPSTAAYEDYTLRFAKYMTAWDLYNNQFLLHLVARKNQNDQLGQKRWLSDEGLRGYRMGLKEDAAVLEGWKEEKDRHESVVKEWAVLRDGLRDEESRRTRAKMG